MDDDLRGRGYHTLTLFGLDTPWRIFARENDPIRGLAEERFLASMNQWLDEPLQDCVAVARDGGLSGVAGLAVCGRRRRL